MTRKQKCLSDTIFSHDASRERGLLVTKQHCPAAAASTRRLSIFLSCTAIQASRHYMHSGLLHYIHNLEFTSCTVILVRGHITPKLPFPWEDQSPHKIHDALGTSVPISEGTQIGSAILEGSWLHPTDKQTHTQTNHATHVAIGHIL